MTASIRAARRVTLVLLGGVGRLDTVHTSLADGFELVAMGCAVEDRPGHAAFASSGSAA